MTVVFTNVNGEFCLPCLLFSSGTDMYGYSLEHLYRTPMISFTRVTTLFKVHSSQASHLTAKVKSSAFVERYERSEPDEVEQLQYRHSEMAQEDTVKLKSITNCLVFCGKQKIHSMHIVEMIGNPAMRTQVLLTGTLAIVKIT